MITHYDLFSGIGGFAYAIDQVYGKENTKHIFIENDPFCKAVLRKHWLDSEIHGDIQEFIARAEGGESGEQTEQERRKNLGGGDSETIANTRSEKQRGLSDGERKEISEIGECFILTGGFPCQPFSQAGRRKGTADDRYLWPEMFRVIQLTKPQWVIAENVRGLVTWNEGMVFEQVCADLESERYEVQPFIIPAVAVNAPHRRDRVWIIGKRLIKHSISGNGTGESASERTSTIPKSTNQRIYDAPIWNENWLEAATRLCGVDDGLSARVDGFEFTASAHRRERLKSLGNAIVPQVAVEIMKAIKGQK